MQKLQQDLQLRYPEMSDPRMSNAGQAPFRFVFRWKYQGYNYKNNEKRWCLSCALMIQRQDLSENLMDEKGILAIAKYFPNDDSHTTFYDIHFIKFGDEVRSVTMLHDIEHLRKPAQETLDSWQQNLMKLWEQDFEFKNMMLVTYSKWQAVSKLVDILSVHI